jgi:xylulokinase
MWAPTAGMVMEWCKKNFFFDCGYDEINRLAGEVPFGSEGLVIAPNMCGSVMPNNDPDVKGGVYGIDLKHTRGHFARAIMEGIACLLRQFLEHININIDTVISMGGGAKSSLWCQIKADITNKKIVTLKNKETGCLGTAILAGVGNGDFANVNSAVENLVKTDKQIMPSDNVVNADAVYDRFIALDKLLANRGQSL